MAAHLEEGDLLEVEITSDGILLRPQKMIDSTQAWFWAPDSQAGERSADEDAAAGRVSTFDSGETLVAALTARSKTTKRPRKR